MIPVRWVQGHARKETDGYRNIHVKQQKRLILVAVESNKQENLKTKIIFECPIAYLDRYCYCMLFHELLKLSCKILTFCMKKRLNSRIHNIKPKPKIWNMSHHFLKHTCNANPLKKRKLNHNKHYPALS